MNEEEMFKELKFKLAQDTQHVMRYEKQSREDDYVGFYKDEKCVCISDDEAFVSISMRLLKAIVQQCKELGWLSKEEEQ